MNPRDLLGSPGKALEPLGSRGSRAPWGPKKGKKKEAILSNNDEFGRLSRFPKNILFMGVIFQNGFSPKAVQPEASGVYKNPRTHLEVQGSFGDEGTFQECQKS